MSVLQLDDAKAHLRVTITDDDTLIQSKIDAAEAWIVNFLGVSLTDATTFPNGAPPDVLEAIRQLVAFFYDNREAAVVGNTITITQLTPGLYDLLAPYRTYAF